MNLSTLIMTTLVLCQASAPPDQSDEQSPSNLTPSEPVEHTASDTGTARVILELGGEDTAHGVLLSSSGEELKLQTPNNQIRVFRPEQVLEIVRLVDPVEGQQGRVYLRNGQSHRGTIVKDGFHQVIINVEGIDISWNRQQVQFVELEPTFEEQYDQYKKRLDESSWPRHLLFVRWLLKEDKPKLALIELQHIERFHDTPEVRNLILIAKARIELNDHSETQVVEVQNPRTPADTSLEKVKVPRLTEREINRIRIYEIDFSNPPKVNVDPVIIHALIDGYGDHPLMPAGSNAQQQLFEAKPIEIVRFMRRLEAADLIDGIKVTEDPETMRLFRERIHDSFLTRSCGTANCHGGPGVGDFRLAIPSKPDDVTAQYTNYIILRQTARNTNWPMLNFENPEKSLLLQYALPQNQSQKQHPNVRGWKPSLNTSNRQTYLPARNWIKGMSRRPWHTYPINYPPAASESPVPEPNPPASVGQTAP